jgi:hypothetical protein
MRQHLGYIHLSPLRPGGWGELIDSVDQSFFVGLIENV